jgi:hypothetical protein
LDAADEMRADLSESFTIAQVHAQADFPRALCE